MGPAMLLAHGVPGDALHDHAFARLSRRLKTIAYLGAANGDQPRWYRRVANALESRHGADVRHARLGTADEIDEARRVVADADLIYVAGGDVGLLAERVLGCGLDESIRARHQAGVPLIGVSAGAIGLCRFWVRFPEDDPSLVRPTRLACIGAVSLAVDVHDEESDWEELRALLVCWGSDEPTAIVDGWGIPAGGALWVDERGSVTPIGPPPKRLRLERGRVFEIAAEA